MLQFVVSPRYATMATVYHITPFPCEFGLENAVETSFEHKFRFQERVESTVTSSKEGKVDYLVK